MRKSTAVPILIIVGLILSYFEISFLELTVNFSLWSMESRIVFANVSFFSFVAILISLSRKF